MYCFLYLPPDLVCQCVCVCLCVSVSVSVPVCSLFFESTLANTGT